MEDLKVALVQESPVFMDLHGSLKKVRLKAKEASDEDAQLVVFPEAFLSGYPRGLSFGTVVGSRTEEGRKLWQRYYDSSVKEGDEAFTTLSSIASEFQIYLVIGVVEKVKSGTLYCSIFYFDPVGKFLGKHRKLKPTAAERVIWGEGDGGDLNVHPTEVGNIGGLICWENYMPLARTALYQQDIEIYCAPTADHRDSWQHTIQHIALEGRCYVLSCNQYMEKSEYSKDLEDIGLDTLPDILTIGGSAIVDPLGEIIAGPLFGERGILYAELSKEKLIQSKMDFDAVGHYARDDVFQLVSKTKPG